MCVVEYGERVGFNANHIVEYAERVDEYGERVVASAHHGVSFALSVECSAEKIFVVPERGCPKNPDRSTRRPRRVENRIGLKVLRGRRTEQAYFYPGHHGQFHDVTH